ncbi:maleylpyruvate isomerase family mycothiol-dependent enzyme [Nocardiopsis suaedae]|uniref:Maleylpyruvate isomerase family mycothiol-dependent enzyme n=1 Tax=Nocardiopsis suaedae TaxID=3018444 RepID=A0ABT4TG33_9ACTN|nr:maleylpyruvate isomerase family mycothiol-dependent enzyme [Nocardiopsis suaedae]MDA2803591.1 maleylpyruvate isomerase family mycothiol-dependent enzyme [Nocardiopsis suaedae]
MPVEPLELAPAPENLRLLRDATARLLATCERLTDADTGAPTPLPGWTRGHVLNHLARQAPALERLLDWARTGVENRQYASRQARDSEIEEGARRPAAELVADIVRTAGSLDEAVRTLPEEVWGRRIRPFTGEDCTPRRILVIRLRELEVHHADLDMGYRLSAAPQEATRVVLEDVVRYFAGREGAPSVDLRDDDGALVGALGVEEGAGSARRTVTGTPGDLLGWLAGRTGGEGVACPEGLPELPKWV